MESESELTLCRELRLKDRCFVNCAVARLQRLRDWPLNDSIN